MRRYVSEWVRFLGQAATAVSRSVQELFGTTEAAVETRPRPAPHRDDVARSSKRAPLAGRAGHGGRLPPRERRGRD